MAPPGHPPTTITGSAASATMAENLLDGPPNPKRAKLNSPGFSASDSTGKAAGVARAGLYGGSPPSPPPAPPEGGAWGDRPPCRGSWRGWVGPPAVEVTGRDPYAKYRPGYK